MLPFLTAALPGIGGVLRARDDDFAVDEEPAYLPSGTGDHVMVRLEKRGLTTIAAVTTLARALNVNVRDVGVAGMKDRHAVTRQWISLPSPVTPEAVLALGELPGVRILEAARHGNKLRTGHVRANRFVLRVTGLADAAIAAERARAILDVLAAAPGAPNWYGEQRFGRDGDNAARGRELVTNAGRGGRGSRGKRLDRLMISALQSELFNTWLEARLHDGLYRRVLAGDVLHKRGGGMFDCTDAAVDEARLIAGELCATGPMFGDRMRRPADGSDAAVREDAVLAAAGLARDSFAAVRAIAEGTRRDAAITIGEPTVAIAPASDGDAPGAPTAIVVAFALPSGAYATVVMREIMKTEATPSEGEPDAAEGGDDPP